MKPKRPRGGMTGAEFEAWLKETGQYDAWVERLRQQEEEIKKRVAEERRAETPLIEDLRAAGIYVQEAWNLYNTPGAYPKAVPILLSHLPRPYPSAVRVGIARALAEKGTRALSWDALIRFYKDEADERVKSAIAGALGTIADDKVIDDVLALVRDTRHGSARVLLLMALERSKDPRGMQTIVDLTDDPDLKKEVQVIIGRRKARKRRMH